MLPRIFNFCQPDGSQGERTADSSQTIAPLRERRTALCMRLVLLPLALLSPWFPTRGQTPLASAKPVPAMQAVPLPHHVTSFQLNGRELTACHFDPADRRVFWYPIRATRDVSLTRMGHPHDPQGHSHHNGVWISHNDVNGISFWADRGAKSGRIVNVEISREGYTDSDESASMRMVNHWIADADEAVQLIEVRRTEVIPLKGAASWFMIIDLEYTAPKGMTSTFGPTPFGLVGVRMAKSIGVIDGGGRILNSAGDVNEAGVFRKPSEWCDYSGRITNEADGFSGITLLNHPGNPQNPTPFHVRDDGWMCACLNLESSIEVSAEKPLRLRYGLWVHDGVAGAEQCTAAWRRFADLPMVELNPPKK